MKKSYGPRSEDQCTNCKAHAMTDTTLSGVPVRYCRRCKRIAQTDLLPEDPLELLTPDERRDLHDDLARLASLRRRAEAESRNLPLD